MFLRETAADFRGPGSGAPLLNANLFERKETSLKNNMPYAAVSLLLYVDLIMRN